MLTHNIKSLGGSLKWEKPAGKCGENHWKRLGIHTTICYGRTYSGGEAVKGKIPSLLVSYGQVILSSALLLVGPVIFVPGRAGADGGGENFMPSNLLRLNQRLSHHVIVVEKYGHQLFIYKNQDSRPVLLRSYSVATGKYSGDKISRGDKKTPEGVFFITDFRSSHELIAGYGKKEGAIYGAGAFVLDYPNPIDLIQGKTGHGIWLHSTDQEQRISTGTDSKGCVVALNRDLLDISRFIELGKTPLVITQNKHFLPRDSWWKRRKELEDLLEAWRANWEREDFARYISHYHAKKYWDRFRKNFQGFKHYKRAVFNHPGKPRISISDVSIFSEKNHVIIQFIQHYQSKKIADTGKKTLYLMQDNSYQWRIVHETWLRPQERADQVAFTPSQRFFPQQAKN